MLPRPSNPTNLPIRSPSSFSCFNRCKPGATLCADDAAHQWPFFLRCALANHIAAANKILRFGKFGVAIVMNRDHFRSEEHTSELQSLTNLVCRLLLEKKKK